MFGGETLLNPFNWFTSIETPILKAMRRFGFLLPRVTGNTGPLLAFMVPKATVRARCEGGLPGDGRGSEALFPVLSFRKQMASPVDAHIS